MTVPPNPDARDAPAPPSRPRSGSTQASARQVRHRVEGPAKVTGTAKYVDDVREMEFRAPIAHGVVVTSARARARIAGIDAQAALAVPGVSHVVTHEDAPKLRKFLSISMSETGERLPLQQDVTAYRGEAVAVVVADTHLAAEEAASRVRVRYEDADAPVAARLADAGDRLQPVKRAGIAPGTLQKGDAQADYAAAPVQVEVAVRTAPYHHNAMETGATIAQWDADGGLRVRTATQWHHLDTMALGRAFGLGARDGMAGFLARKLLGTAHEGRVRLTNHPAGGAFGRNLATPHLFLAAIAAKVSGRAVKIALTRAQTFTLSSYRSEVAQRLRLGAEADGRLTAMIHEADIAVGAAGKYVEPVGGSPFELYAHRSHALTTRVARLDLNGTGWMRAPGNMSAAFALETAMDALARQTGIDPVELRLRNHTDVDLTSGKPFGQKALRHCYEAGAAAFGWAGRQGGGGRDGQGWQRGCGMATAYEHAFRFPASAGLRLGVDGRARVELTIAEMGQGAWTALVDVAADALGLPAAAVELDHARTDIPAGAGSVASTGTRSNVASIRKAADRVRGDLIKTVVRDRASPLHGLEPQDVRIADGLLIGPGNRRETVGEAMGRRGREIAHVATTGRDFGRSNRASASFGAVFAEVAVDPLTLDVRVSRLLGAFDCGRILQPSIVEAQLTGAMVWGLGAALMEETRIDPRTGAWTNPEIGEALVPTGKDAPDVRAITVTDPSLADDPMAMKGAAEIGLIGVAPAIANAIHDAIGVRHSALPMRVDERISAL